MGATAQAAGRKGPRRSTVGVTAALRPQAAAATCGADLYGPRFNSVDMPFARTDSCPSVPPTPRAQGCRERTESRRRSPDPIESPNRETLPARRLQSKIFPQPVRAPLFRHLDESPQVGPRCAAFDDQVNVVGITQYARTVKCSSRAVRSNCSTIEVTTSILPKRRRRPAVQNVNRYWYGPR